MNDDDTTFVRLGETKAVHALRVMVHQMARMLIEHGADLSNERVAMLMLLSHGFRGGDIAECIDRALAEARAHCIKEEKQ